MFGCLDPLLSDRLCIEHPTDQGPPDAAICAGEAGSSYRAVMWKPTQLPISM